MEEIGFLSFLALMLLSLGCSLFISFLYSRFYQARATGSQVHRAFPLLGISITAIFISIQFSLPLSLGLLGALSIVRFRNPVKEPEEIGFIMLVVATSLCCATFNILFMVILLIVAIVALFILRYGQGLLKGKLNDGMLIISMPPDQYEKNNKNVLNTVAQRLPQSRLESVSENDDEAIISISFRDLEQDSMYAVQADLKAITASVNVNVYFNRSGEI
jgi:hypothetical protein